MPRYFSPTPLTNACAPSTPLTIRVRPVDTAHQLVRPVTPSQLAHYKIWHFDEQGDMNTSSAPSSQRLALGPKTKRKVRVSEAAQEAAGGEEAAAQKTAKMIAPKHAPLQPCAGSEQPAPWWSEPPALVDPTPMDIAPPDTLPSPAAPAASSTSPLVAPVPEAKSKAAPKAKAAPKVAAASTSGGRAKVGRGKAKMAAEDDDDVDSLFSTRSVLVVAPCSLSEPGAIAPGLDMCTLPAHRHLTKRSDGD